MKGLPLFGKPYLYSLADGLGAELRLKPEQAAVKGMNEEQTASLKPCAEGLWHPKIDRVSDTRRVIAQSR